MVETGICRRTKGQKEEDGKLKVVGRAAAGGEVLSKGAGGRVDGVHQLTGSSCAGPWEEEYSEPLLVPIQFSIPAFKGGDLPT